MYDEDPSAINSFGLNHIEEERVYDGSSALLDVRRLVHTISAIPEIDEGQHIQNTDQDVDAASRQVGCGLVTRS